MDKDFLKKMAELDDAAQGEYIAPVSEKEREAAYEETRKTIELMKQGKWAPSDVRRPLQKS